MSIRTIIRALFGDTEASSGQALREVQADADETGARAMVGRLKRELAEHPSRGLTPATLYSILEEAEAGNLRRQHELASDMEEKDPQIQSDLAKRRQAVAELDWSILPPDEATPAEERAADQASEVMGGLEVEDLLIDMGDGLLHGWVNLSLPWATDGAARICLQPTWVPHSRFQLHPDDQDLLTLRDGSRTGEALWPLGWVQHRHRAKSGYVARMGLLRVLVWPYLFQNYALGDLAELLEILGIPIRLGKYPGTATGEQKRALLRALAEMGHTAAGAIPDSMSVELLEAASGSEKPFEAMLNWCERSKSKAILGGTLTTGTDQGSGAYALGSVHERGFGSLIASDCKQYQASIRRFMLWPMAALNYGILDLKRAPRLVIDAGTGEDLVAMAEALPKLVGIGMQIPAAWAHSTLRIPEPQDGEAVLTAPAAPFGAGIPPAAGPALPGPTAAPTAALAALAADLASADPVPDIDPRVLTRLVAEAQPAIDAMVEQVRTILNKADSLEEALTLIGAAYPSVDSRPLAEAMTQAALVAQLAGRADVRDEVAG